ncbi:3-hydroxyacyl-CoA dehydrogenase/enoyl-CoA hydratase family protein [Patescibacteria group bacterium]
MQFDRDIGIIGAGVIGHGLAYPIATAIAMSGGKVIIHDTNPEALERGISGALGYAAKGLMRGKISKRTADAIKQAIVPAKSLEDFRSCGLVIEAAVEDLNIKKQILAGVEEVVTPDCLIGFTTSGLCRSWIVEGAKHPDRGCVIHPFFPAWRSPPIEVVGVGKYFKQMYDLMIHLGKVPIKVADVPCFAADLIFCSYEAEAIRLEQDGVATRYQVDLIANKHIGGGGPYLVHDLTGGNPLTIHCLELLQEHHQSEWFQTPQLLIDQGTEKWLEHQPDPEKDAYDAATEKAVMDRLHAVLLGTTFHALDNELCAPGDLDWLTRMALGFKTGLLEMGNNMGMGQVRDLCQAYAKDNPGFPTSKTIDGGTSYHFFKDTTWEVSEDNGIAVVTVRRPEAANALRKNVIQELDAIFLELAADDAVKGIIFTGFGGMIAGADIMELASLKTPAECAEFPREGQMLTLAMEQLNKPIVAVIDGVAFGGGAEMAMACWARVLGPKALIGQPEVKLGIVPGYGGTQRLPRLVGMERSLEMLRLGNPIKATTAVEWGWASKCSPDPMREAELMIRNHCDPDNDFVLEPLSHDPMKQVPIEIPELDIGHLSLVIDRILLDTVFEGLGLTMEHGLEFEANACGRCKETQDMGIGMANFIQNKGKAPAVFVNK